MTAALMSMLHVKVVLILNKVGEERWSTCPDSLPVIMDGEGPNPVNY